MSLISAFLSISRYWPLLLTVAAYLFAVWLQRKTKLTLLNPILISALLIIPVLLLSGTSLDAYTKGTEPLSYLLTPATICLGLSLYEQLQKLKNDLPAVLAGVIAGTITSLGTVWGICALFGVGKDVTVSMLPKSVTTAIGIALSEQGNGIVALTAAVIVITGLFGNLAGGLLSKLLQIKDPVARGVAYGTASHVIGTSRAITEGAMTGAVGSLSLAVAGLLTAILFPIVTAWI